MQGNETRHAFPEWPWGEAPRGTTEHCDVPGEGTGEGRGAVPQPRRRRLAQSARGASGGEGESNLAGLRILSPTPHSYTDEDPGPQI